MPPEAPPSKPRPVRTGLASRGDRIGAGAAALACLVLLSVAAFLSPTHEGHGTHEQLGLAPCAWVALFDKPCPTCGMTTSFAHTADASYLTAASTQPLGFLLALGVAGNFWTMLHTAVFGSRAAHTAMGLVNGRSLVMLLVLGLGAWVYKLATWG